jgi:hypothetical protein
MLLALLIGWIAFSYLFAEFAPVLFAGLAYLIGFLFLCLWEVSQTRVPRFGVGPSAWLGRHGVVGAQERPRRVSRLYIPVLPGG